MPQRQCAAGLDFTQRKAGVQVLHIWQIHQVLQRKPAESFKVLRHYLQLKRAVAADVVARHDIGQFFDGFFQLARGIAAVALGVQPHKGQYAEADLAALISAR